jgi:hypothetical protein
MFDRRVCFCVSPAELKAASETPLEAAARRELETRRENQSQRLAQLLEEFAPALKFPTETASLGSRQVRIVLGPEVFK